MKKFTYQKNCIPAHSDHICMPNWFEGEYNSFRMSLDGLWKFSYEKNMDFPVTGYEKYFTLPVNMRGGRICISFQGAECEFAVWLNGKYVGYCENLYEPAEFELTPYLTEGENKLAVRVWREKSDDFSEMFRSVYLYSVPRTHLWDVQIIPELADDLSEATLTIITTSCGKGEVEIRLLDDAMVPMLEGIMAIEEGEEGSDAIQSGIAGMVYQPKLWSAEEPNLYMLQLEVRDELGDLTEVITQYVGFRRFEAEDGVMKLNGKPLVLKGIKCPDFCAERGRLLDREALAEELAARKQNNINFARTSHFANNPYLYEVCDEYGMYLIVDHVDASYEIKSHHPSVLIQSNEDEVLKDIYEIEPKMQEVKFAYQDILVEFTDKAFTVWNKHLFMNTDKYEASAILQKDGVPIAKVALPISVESMEQKCFDIPQQLFSIMDNLKVASAVHDGEVPEFAITVSFSLPADNAWGKKGHEVAFGQYVYKKEVAPYVCKETLELIEDVDKVILKGRDFKAVFAASNGSLVSYVYGGMEMLKGNLCPNFWRVPVDKSASKLMKNGYAQWKLASMYATVREDENVPVVEVLEDSVKLTYIFDMPTNPASSCKVTYHVFGDGTIETTMVYEQIEGLCDMPEFGMMFKLDAAFGDLSWYGYGPEESYAERAHGGKLGLYENKVIDNMAKSLVPQECGNKCGVRFAEVTNAKGHGIRFFGDELSVCALPYTPHEIENATRMDELPEVQNTVVRVALSDVFKKKVFTFCFRGV